MEPHSCCPLGGENRLPSRKRGVRCRSNALGHLLRPNADVPHECTAVWFDLASLVQRPSPCALHKGFRRRGSPTSDASMGSFGFVLRRCRNCAACQAGRKFTSYRPQTIRNILPLGQVPRPRRPVLRKNDGCRLPCLFVSLVSGLLRGIEARSLGRS